MDGAFGNWIEWSDCTKRCGGGMQYRTRECNNPLPSGGGEDCKGSNIETQKCGVEICRSNFIFV